VADVAGRLAGSAPTEIAWTEDPSDVDGAVESLEGRRLVLVGGDGTFHLALNRLSALDRLDEPIGLIPAGTGNDFARGAGLGSDVARAVEIVLADRPRRHPVIDLGGTELAHNNVHVGLGLVAAERGTAWKPRLGRFAYPVATLVEGLSYKGLEVTLRSGSDLLFEGRALAVLVLLGPSMGGGIEPVEGVDVDVARLDVIVVEPVRPVARPGLAVAALRQGLDHARDVRRWTLDEVVLSAPAGLRGDVDGEVRSWDREVVVRVDPHGWMVLSPPG
jgi:diacylglycerol kinase family enzyme